MLILLIFFPPAASILNSLGHIEYEEA